MIDKFMFSIFTDLETLIVILIVALVIVTS